MCNNIIKHKIIILSFIVLLFMQLTICCSADNNSATVPTIIFEENFDSQPDWNATGQYEYSECSVLNVGAPANQCTFSTYPANWSFYRSVPGAKNLNPVASIRRLPGGIADHTSGTGKAFIVYNESVNGATWPGDGILGKFFGMSANYPELYVRFWMRTQSGWRVVNGAQSKLFRVLSWRGTENIFQWAAESSPIFFWDLAASGSNAAYAPAYRCDASPGDYYCASLGSGNNFEKNDIITVWGNGPPSSRFADTQWHRYDFHFKMNSIGSADGIMEWSYDGVSVESRTNVVWKESSSSVAKGWNAFALGGNSNNIFSSSPTDQWYAIDDVVVSTTPIPEFYVIGSSAQSNKTNAPIATIPTNNVR